MSAARKRKEVSNSAAWRNSAIAAVQICWKKMSPEGDRDERLAWIGEFLGIKDLQSLTDLSDDQLGAVAGEMKKLTGRLHMPNLGDVRDITHLGDADIPHLGDNVVEGSFGANVHRSSAASDKWSVGYEERGNKTVFLNSPEMVYTLEKLIGYVRWSQDHIETFLVARFGTRNLRMLTYPKAKIAVNTFLRIAAHQDLKLRKGGDKPVSRDEINKYIPILKRELRIDQGDK